MNFTITKVSNGYVLSLDKGLLQAPEKFVFNTLDEVMTAIRRRVE